MSSIVAGGIFNAVAFAGAGFLFSRLNHNGYEDEIKRHNKALEDFAKAKQAWTERETARKNRITRLRLERADADKDFEKTNRALRLLQKVREASADDREPTIHDFYEPSAEMKKYQDITIGGIGLVTGATIMKIISSFDGSASFSLV